MAASVKQWDKDWIDAFKTIVEQQLTNLQIYPTNPIGWCRILDIAFGNKQAEQRIRNPNQDIGVSKNKEKYRYKYASRLVQKLDMPYFQDALSIEEEYYAGDSINAMGHVSDINQNFFDKVGRSMISGASVAPLFYGLIDTGAGTGSTTIERPDPCDQAGSLSTTGAWTTYNNLATDLSQLENGLQAKGFMGRKIICTHSLVKAYLKNWLISYTDSPYMTALGYTWIFNPYYDEDATKDAVDVWMFDENSYSIAMTPINSRAYFNDEMEEFQWHWNTRAVPMPNPLNDDTDWIAGKIKLAIDLDGA